MARHRIAHSSAQSAGWRRPSGGPAAASPGGDNLHAPTASPRAPALRAARRARAGPASATPYHVVATVAVVEETTLTIFVCKGTLIHVQEGPVTARRSAARRGRAGRLAPPLRRSGVHPARIRRRAVRPPGARGHVAEDVPLRAVRRRDVRPRTDSDAIFPAASPDGVAWTVDPLPRARNPNAAGVRAPCSPSSTRRCSIPVTSATRPCSTGARSPPAGRRYTWAMWYTGISRDGAASGHNGPTRIGPALSTDGVVRRRSVRNPVARYRADALA